MDVREWLRAHGLDERDVTAVRHAGGVTTVEITLSAQPLVRELADSRGNVYREVRPGEFRRVKANGRTGWMTFTADDIMRM